MLLDCQSGSRSTSPAISGAAVATLRMLLARPDLPAALREHEAQLDEDLHQVVKLHAGVAAADGNSEAVALLDYLGASVERAIARREGRLRDWSPAATKLEISPRLWQLTGYQQQILAYRVSEHLLYPRQVHLETTAACNASCSFCPHSKASNKNKMPSWLIEKILRDLQDIPGHVPLEINPHRFNEPFMDPRWEDVLSAIAVRLPQARIVLNTNLSLLDEAALGSLLRIKTVTMVGISMNEHRQEPYERVMGLGFERTLRNARALHERKAAGEVGFDVLMTRVGDQSPADQEFKDWCQETFPLFLEPQVMPRLDWLGCISTNYTVPDVGCHNWFNLAITCSGTVALCCADHSAAYPVGDVKLAHVLDVYNAPRYRKLREATLSRLELEPCCHCTSWGGPQIEI